MTVVGPDLTSRVPGVTSDVFPALNSRRPKYTRESLRGVSEEVGQHGKARIHVNCSTKEDVRNRHLTAITDTFALGGEKKVMLKRNAWARGLEQYWARGKRPMHAREYLWEVDEEEIGPMVGYSLTARLLPHPSPAAESDWVRWIIIRDQPDLFKITFPSTNLMCWLPTVNYQCTHCIRFCKLWLWMVRDTSTETTILVDGPPKSFGNPLCHLWFGSLFSGMELEH